MRVPGESVTNGALARFLAQHEPKAGMTLVVGSRMYDGTPDRRAYYADAVGLDMQAGPGVDLVHDLEEPLPGWEFDHVDLCSVLEHVRRPWLLAANVQALMAPGATILVSVPFVWRMHAYPSDYWRMTPEALDVLFPRIEWQTKRFVVGPKVCKKVPALTAGQVYMARAETVAFGCLKS